MGINFVIFNVLKVKSVGVEIEFLVNLVEGFNVGLNVIYVDVCYFDDCVMLGVDVDIVYLFCGNCLINVVFWIGVMNVSYECDFGVNMFGFLNGVWCMEFDCWIFM